MASEVSHLFEQVESQLLSDDNKYTVVLIDQGEVKYTQEIETELNSIFNFDPTPFLPNAQVMNLERFIDIAGQVIKDAQEREGIVETEQVQLVQEYPREELAEMGDEVITFKVLKRIPANMDSKGTSRPQRGSNFAYSLRSSMHPNKIIVVESRPIDHTIQFSCWAKTATLANKRALWLERLFVNHKWAFIVQGVDRFYWMQRGADTLWTGPNKMRLHQRPLEFFVRISEFENRAYPVLQQLNIELKLS